TRCRSRRRIGRTARTRCTSALLDGDVRKSGDAPAPQPGRTNACRWQGIVTSRGNCKEAVMADKPRENLFGLLTSDPNRVYVIAEAGVNHGGKKERALALVRAAKWTGADAGKFQTFRADRLASTQPAALAHTKDQPNLQELFKKLELPFDTFR